MPKTEKPHSSFVFEFVSIATEKMPVPQIFCEIVVLMDECGVKSEWQKQLEQFGKEPRANSSLEDALQAVRREIGVKKKSAS